MRRPPNDGRGVQRLPGHRIEPVEVQLRELRDDRLDGDGLDVHVRAVLEGGRREPQRERVAPGEAVDPLGVGGVDARLAQERLGVGARQPARAGGPEQRGRTCSPSRSSAARARTGRPGRSRSATGRTPAAARRRTGGTPRRCRATSTTRSPRLLEPGAASAGLGEVGAGRVRERRQEPPLRRLDRAAVEAEHRRAAVPRLVRERLDERRLAHARRGHGRTRSSGPSASSRPWRTARSSSRPTSPAARSSISCRTVTVISGVCARCQSRGEGRLAMGHGGLPVRGVDVATVRRHRRRTHVEPEDNLRFRIDDRPVDVSRPATPSVARAARTAPGRPARRGTRPGRRSGSGR